MHGSKDEPCIFIYWIILIHKNLKVSKPIGEKCKGKMNDVNVFRFGVPHLHLYINIYIDGDAGRRIRS